MTTEHTEFKDWLGEVITDSLDVDWTSTDAARLIVERLGEQPVYDAAHDLLDELKEARTSLSITRTNIMTEINRWSADPSESRWAGVPELLKERLDKIDAAIAKAEGRP